MCFGGPLSAAKQLPPRGGFPSAKSDTACFQVCPSGKSESGLGEFLYSTCIRDLEDKIV